MATDAVEGYVQLARNFLGWSKSYLAYGDPH